jgi:hypothetical protein
MVASGGHARLHETIPTVAGFYRSQRVIGSRFAEADHLLEPFQK